MQSKEGSVLYIHEEIGMDFYRHLKTPKMINERQDGACPFCLTQLKHEAFVCAACGAHQWHIPGATPVSRGQFQFGIILTILIFVMFIYLSDLINFLELFLRPILEVFVTPDIVWIIKPVTYIFYGFWILVWLAHIYEFIESGRTNGGKTRGTVWRRRRW